MESSFTTLSIFDIILFGFGVVAVIIGWVIKKRDDERYEVFKEKQRAFAEELDAFAKKQDAFAKKQHQVFGTKRGPNRQ